ncbi:MAG: ParA family protein [Deltaproteobacteria bacterium]|nr:MAG: ParA family protein [Deltaproteobacteria bacterium]
MTALVRFDEALDRAIDYSVKHLDDLGRDVVIVRDLFGRIRIALGNDAAVTDELGDELHALLGAFSPGATELIMQRASLLAPEAIFAAAELRQITPGVRLLERWVVGADWLRAPLPRKQAKARRITFFGIKGGVGRSTALIAIARHLAEHGRRVLVVDLDLESPGVTASLLPAGILPSFGVVDWFVEDDVGQADSALLRQLVASSPLATGTTGEIRVVPAGGTIGTESYVSKLGRIYTAPPGKGDFAVRLAGLLDELEAAEQPDWVLLDSRAGIHDLAAVAVTRLDATSLLFAVDTPQTWLAYRYRLRIVAGQVPETDRERYLEGLRDSASVLFEDYLYDAADANDDDAFNFDVGDRDAPHSPVPIYWRRELQGWDPTREPPTVTPDQLRGAFGELLDYVDDTLASAT